MKTIIAAAAAAAFFLAAAPAAAETSGFESWLSAEVEQRMHYPFSLARTGIGGTATVSFEAGPDGRAQAVALETSSGEPTLDRSAVATVSALSGIPADAPAGRHYVVLQYGNAGEAQEQAMRTALAEARSRGRAALAASGRDGRSRG